MDQPTLDFSHISPVRTYSQKKKGQSALRLYIDTFVHPNSITVRSCYYIINRTTVINWKLFTLITWPSWIHIQWTPDDTASSYPFTEVITCHQYIMFRDM